MLLFQNTQSNKPATTPQMVMESINAISGLKAEFATASIHMQQFNDMVGRNLDYVVGSTYSSESFRMLAAANTIDAKTLGFQSVKVTFENFAEQQSPLIEETNPQGVIAGMWSQIKERASAAYGWVKSKIGSFTNWFKMLFTRNTVKQIDLLTQRAEKMTFPTEEDKAHRLEALKELRAYAVEIEKIATEYKHLCDKTIDVRKFEEVLGVMNMEEVTMINGEPTGFYSTENESVMYRHQRVMEIYTKLLAELSSYGTSLELLNMAVIKFAFAVIGDSKVFEGIEGHLKGGDGLKSWIASVSKGWSGVSKLCTDIGSLITVSSAKDIDTFMKVYQKYTKELSDVSVENATIGSKLSSIFSEK